MASRGRRHSCPPCVEHDDADVVQLSNGLACMVRSAYRELCYKALQIEEDRDYLWALLRRDQALAPLPAYVATSPCGSRSSDSSTGLPVSVELGGWTCDCGKKSPVHALFCWNCGHANPVKQPSKVNAPNFASGMVQNKSHKSGLKNDLRSAKPSTKESTQSLSSVISKFKLDASCGMSMNGTPSLGSVSVVDDVSTTDDAAQNTSDADNSATSAECPDGQQQEITTQMICALPFQITGDRLIAAIDTLGFAGLYDFVYIPSRSTKKHPKLKQGNVGYGFVNFRDPEDAAQFATAFSGYNFPGVVTAKQISVRAAACQGYEANVLLHSEKLDRGGIMTFPAFDAHVYHESI